MTGAYRYQFREGIDPRDVEDTLLLAFLAAEGVFGEARVRLDGAYSADHEERTLTMGASTAVGKIINAVFTVYAVKEFGRDGFTVRPAVGEEGACHCAPTATVCPSSPAGIAGPSRRVRTPRRTTPAKRPRGARQRSKTHRPAKL